MAGTWMAGCGNKIASFRGEKKELSKSSLLIFASYQIKIGQAYFSRTAIKTKTKKKTKQK